MEGGAKTGTKTQSEEKDGESVPKTEDTKDKEQELVISSHFFFCG